MLEHLDTINQLVSIIATLLVVATAMIQATRWGQAKWLQQVHDAADIAVRATEQYKKLRGGNTDDLKAMAHNKLTELVPGVDPAMADNAIEAAVQRMNGDRTVDVPQTIGEAVEKVGATPLRDLPADPREWQLPKDIPGILKKFKVKIDL